MEENEMALPTVDFCGTAVTRLIIGGNPFRAYSHFSEELDREMQNYYTCANTVSALSDAERAGINTVVMRGDAIIFDVVRSYREQGGRMHWIAQTASEHPDFSVNIREIAALGPLAIYYHGSRTDQCWKEGRIGEVADQLKEIRDLGCPVGLASHMPEVLRHAEEQGWDVDFYMTCLYNISKVDRGSVIAGAARVEEPFDDPDRDIMCAFIRSTRKPCLAFKVLGSRRKAQTPEMLRRAFAYALENIKPTDAMVVGMFQKYRDEAAENAAIVKQLLGQDEPGPTRK